MICRLANVCIVAIADRQNSASTGQSWPLPLMKKLMGRFFRQSAGNDGMQRDNVSKKHICTQCINNFGLRQVLEKHATIMQTENCQSCLRRGGYVIDDAVAEAGMHYFFVSGSIPPETGGAAPLYQFNAHQYPGDIEFATELDADLRLLSDLLGVGLFHYGPALWRLGYTEHYQMLQGDGVDNGPIDGDSRKQLWDEIFSKCALRELEPGSLVFRVRRGNSLPPAMPSKFDTPPKAAAGGGRYDSQDFPVFYGAPDIETCLHEARVTLADWISLATFTPTRPLRLVDLADGIDDSSAQTPFERVDILMRKLAFDGKQDYELCREMAMEIHARGFDGFYFTSYFSQAHHQNLKNTALFGCPAAEGKLRLISTNRVLLSAISYEYTFGPTNDNHLPIDDEKLKEVIAMMKADDSNQNEAKKAFDELLGRRSDGPR